MVVLEDLDMEDLDMVDLVMEALDMEVLEDSAMVALDMEALDMGVLEEAALGMVVVMVITLAKDLQKLNTKNPVKKAKKLSLILMLVSPTL